MRRTILSYLAQWRGGALGLTCVPLLATGNCQLMTGPPPTREESCLASFQAKTWAVLGLLPEQVPDTPDQLLKARLAVGDTAPLHVTTLGQAAECDDLVTGVAWGSTLSAVAGVAASGMAGGELEARSPGETAVWADVTLRDGSARRAELYAIPAGRSARLRVYAVQVTR